MKKLVQILIISLFGMLSFVNAQENSGVACPMVYEPVCGVDGKTYGNECEAIEQAGVEVDYKGKCERDDDSDKSSTSSVDYEIFNSNLIDNPGNYVIKSEQDLSSKLGVSLEEFENNVTDFKNNFVVSSMGRKNTGGYSIDIKSVEKSNGDINVNLKHVSPGAGCMVTQVITNPTKIIQINEDNFEGDINVNVENVVEDCSLDNPDYGDDDSNNNGEYNVFCTEQYKPVCGVDGKTYSNECTAKKQNNTKVKYEGECLSRSFEIRARSKINGTFNNFVGDFDNYKEKLKKLISLKNKISSLSNETDVLSKRYSIINFINLVLKDYIQKNIFEEYIKNNISSISPSKEVLGGKWYIEKINWSGFNKAKVKYSDGHIVEEIDIEISVEDGNIKVTVL